MRKLVKVAKKSDAGGGAKLSFWSYVYNILLLSLAPILFFSYYPIISFGSNQTMNFELSLPLIWLVIFDLTSLILLFRNRVRFRFSKIWMWLLFPGFLSISVFWSLNPLRGILTAGILWLIYFAVFSFFTLQKTVQFLPNFGRFFWRIFFGASLLVSGWCWLQCVLDLVGFSQSVTLMCDGCVYQMFGFPHPDGFAIEPQFMGNLLLAPTLMAAWFTFATGGVVRWLIFFVLTATLFLTFSRGAIYAFLIGLTTLTIWRMVQVRSARPLISWVVAGVAFLFTLNAQGLMAELGPTSDTYPVAVSKVVHQLSLGLIDFRPVETVSENFSIGTGLADFSDSESRAEVNVTPQPIPNLESAVESGESVVFSEDERINASGEPIFEGYVAESTNTRLRLTDSALKIWSSNPRIMIFGVGLGGAGQALYDNGLSPAPKEIVQNQYVSLLLETGLLGCFLAIFTIFLVFRYLSESSPMGSLSTTHSVSRKSDSSPMGPLSRSHSALWRFGALPFRVPIFALILAYAVTLCFFSGLANALQIYLMPPLILLISRIRK